MCEESSSAALPVATATTTEVTGKKKVDAIYLNFLLTKNGTATKILLLKKDYHIKND
jgi:hypothetical protein